MNAPRTTTPAATQRQTQAGNGSGASLEQRTVHTGSCRAAQLCRAFAGDAVLPSRVLNAAARRRWAGADLTADVRRTVLAGPAVVARRRHT